MNEYTPDCWTVIHIDGPDPHYRVLAGWSGGYLHGSSWKLNSGITHIERDGDYILFHGSSGSVYRCHQSGYGLKMSTAGIWNQLKAKYGDQVELLDETTDWNTVDWRIR
jgi:hypothetical protein